MATIEATLHAPLQINDRCLVQWSNTTSSKTANGEVKQQSCLLAAVIVERRPHRESSSSGNSSSVSTTVTTAPGSSSAAGGGGTKRKYRRTADGSAAAGVMIDKLAANAVDYYVHYVDHDRRLDEWVTLDKFQLDTLQRHNDETFNPKSNGVTDGTPTAPASTELRSLPVLVAVDVPPPLEDTAAGGEPYDDGGGGSGPARSNARRRSSGGSATNGVDNPRDGGGGAAASAILEQHVQPFSFSGGNWHTGSSNDPVSAAFEREHEETTKVKNIEKMVMGSWEVAVWYYSPFPDEYSDVDTLYVCEFCLTYMKKRKSLIKHKAECPCRHPPGREIYRESDLSVYELDGREHRAYCQKLCLLAKLFLDHKTLYYDVTPFYFYVVAKVDSNGAHVVGYFSKEKMSTEGYNLACILTFPQYQQAGYGKFIISLSYELTKREDKTGSPEKPLSDLGKVSYRSYWTHVLMNLLANCESTEDITINDMSRQTGIKMEDIISTLQSLDMIKVWKGQHVVYVQQSYIEDYLKLKKKLRLCKSEFLNWEPLSGRLGKENA